MDFTEKELTQRVKEFFFNNPAGKQLMDRWEMRVNGFKSKLINSDDPDEIRTLQAKIRYHQEVMSEIL